MKKIATIGITLPASPEQITTLKFRTRHSLSEFDIVIARPCQSVRSYQSAYGYSNPQYKGRYWLDDNDTHKLIEDRNFWKKEFIDFLESGKVLIIFLSTPELGYYSTGQKTYTGTGRNRSTTNQVTDFDPYSMLPISLAGTHFTEGTEIAYRNKNSNLKNLFETISPYTNYKCVIKKDVFEGNPYIFQKNSDSVVGGVLSLQGNGKVILLPDIDDESPEFTENKNGKYYYSKEASIFTNKLISSIVSLANELRKNSDLTPIPDWISDTNYKIAKADILNSEISMLDEKINSIENEKSTLKEKLNESLSARFLLYENGDALENIVRKTLELMGFQVTKFRDDISDFDTVCTSEEGIFLGEIEGKDTSQIDISKMSQLMRNLTEYLEKPTSEGPAKGVLIGNAFRLAEPTKRDAYFTSKCLKSAHQCKIALIKTPDLFPILNYLIDRNDEKYKTICRKAIFSTEGETVIFPHIPTNKTDGKTVFAAEKKKSKPRQATKR